MQRTPVASKSIISAGYDADSRTLEIEYWSTAVVQFSGVPAETYQAFLSAPSKSQYSHACIWGHFPRRRIWRNLDELLVEISEVLVLEEQRPITVHTSGFEGDTPLHTAAIWGDVTAIEMLVAVGAEVDARNNLKTTPLYEAVGQGHVEAARKLLEFGASPHIRNDLDFTPAERAARSDDPEMRELFAIR
ncbi:MAG: KTSC domain-containing protein [Candidatus Hydrogenedentes bacterium]|nr:KTSC domain-containing protein [Candidatus Hydrogenedentota bacterium]